MSTTILDGGMGQELIARSGEATALWSVQALLDNPALVTEVHRDFFSAGAEIATTNSYSVLPDRLAHHDLSDRFEPLQHLACELAVRARDEHGSGRVAGAMGPLGFSYQPDKCPPAEQAAEIYDRVCTIQKTYVDIFLAETMSSMDQARGALMATAVHDIPTWIAFSVDDTDGSKLRSGESVSEIASLVDEFNPQAILINCSIPEAVTQAINSLRSLRAPLGAYANGFTAIAQNFNEIGATVDVLDKRIDLDPTRYGNFATQWKAAGASIIGGCCEVGPAHIRELARLLK